MKLKKTGLNLFLSLLLLINFLSIFILTSSSYACPSIDVTTGSGSLPDTFNIGITEVQCGSNYNTTFGIKDWMEPDTNYIVGARSDYRWGLNNPSEFNSGKDNELRNLPEGYYVVNTSNRFRRLVKLGDPEFGTEANPIVINDGYSVEVQQLVQTDGDSKVDTIFLNQNNSFVNTLSITLSFREQGMADWTTIGSLGRPSSDHLTWLPRGWGRLYDIPDGIYEFRVFAPAVERTYDGKEMHVVYDKIITHEIITRGSRTNPIISSGGFTMDFTKMTPTAGDLSVDTNYTNSRTIQSFTLSYLLNGEGSPITAVSIPSAIPPIENANTWDYLTYPNLSIADGTHTFIIEALTYDEDLGFYYNETYEKEYTITSYGDPSNPLPLGDAFAFAIEEDKGSLNISLTQVDPALNPETITMYITNPLGVREEVGTVTPTGILTLWDPVTFPKLSELEQGLYNISVESNAYDEVTGVYSLLSSDTDFFVVGNLLTMTAKELTFGNLGVEVEVNDPSGTVNSVKLYIKPQAASDDDYELIREETGGAPYQWGLSNPTISDSSLEKMKSGNYTLKAETAIPDPNGGPDILASIEVDVTVIGSPISFIKKEDQRDVGFSVETASSTPLGNINIASVMVEVKKFSEGDSQYRFVRVDDDNNPVPDTFPAYKFGILDLFNFQEYKPLLQMELGKWHARVTLLITMDGEYTDFDDNPNITVVGANGGSPNQITIEYKDIFEFDVTGASDPELRGYLDEQFTKEFKFKIDITNNPNPNQYIGANDTNVQLISSGKLDDQVRDVSLVVTTPSGVDQNLGSKGSNKANWTWGTNHGHALMSDMPPGKYSLGAIIDLGTSVVTKTEPLIISNQVKDNLDPNVTDDNLLGDRLGKFIIDKEPDQ